MWSRYRQPRQRLDFLSALAYNVTIVTNIKAMLMSKVVSMRLQDEQMLRLQKVARTLSKTVSETSSLLLEEKLRENEFACIEFRSSPAGRFAYLKGSRLAVWQVISTARTYFEMDATQTATHFGRHVALVKAAFHYYQRFQEEIDTAIADHAESDFETLKRSIPNAQALSLGLE
ncbi:MAG: transcriptional regulator [Armatimonadetes bacterium]|nr:transcriptional regulator [Armatimonadota bacterium]